MLKIFRLYSLFAILIFFSIVSYSQGFSDLSAVNFSDLNSSQIDFKLTADNIEGNSLKTDFNNLRSTIQNGGITNAATVNSMKIDYDVFGIGSFTNGFKFGLPISFIYSLSQLGK